jgi:hypothetical protein
MKKRPIISSLVCGAVALLLLGSHAKQQEPRTVNVNAASGNEATEAVTGQEEEHSTYRLTAGAHIDVSHISGPVSVEATDGSTAKVSIHRTAPSPDDLAYRRVSVDQTASGMTIRQKNDGTETSSINLLNRVVLTLPRKVSVSGNNISGDFNISGVRGAVDLTSISGSVHVRHLNGALTVSGASGNVRVAVERITDAGLRISNVSGNVYLRLASDLNAELSINQTSGAVSNKIAGLVLQNVGASHVGRIGSGGPRIVVSNVTGAVVLRSL